MLKAFFRVIYNMKICCSCKKEKEDSDFNKNKSRKDGLNTICKDCSRDRSKLYYSQNKEAHKAVVNKSRKVYRKELKDEVDNLKKVGCHFCDEKEIICMDLHHINPNKKEYLISNLVRSVSKKKLQKEIKKCVVVCSNCHRKLHAGILKFN